jgi:hypothetical protein
MSASRRIVIGTLFLFAVLAPTPAPAQGGASTGGTKVSVEGKVVTITVTIDLIIGGFEELPEGAQETADGIAAGIEDYWNQAFERYATDCLEFRLDVVMKALPAAFPPPTIIDLGGSRPATLFTEPGHHVVLWGQGSGINPDANIPPPETYDPYDEDGIAPPGEDYGTPFDHELEALWSDHLENPRDFAHEFGHLFGFGDDYDENGEPLPGREGTLMDNGDLIDQNLVNRLIDLVRDSGEQLPECWEGEWAEGSGFEYGSFCPQFVPISGTISFAVAEDGSLSGDYEWANDPYTCGGPAPSVPNKGEVTGERTADGFLLTIFGEGYPLTLTRQGNEASGKVEAGSNTTHAISVHCVTCG